MIILVQAGFGAMGQTVFHAAISRVCLACMQMAAAERMTRRASIVRPLVPWCGSTPVRLNVKQGRMPFPMDALFVQTFCATQDNAFSPAILCAIPRVSCVTLMEETTLYGLVVSATSNAWTGFGATVPCANRALHWNAGLDFNRVDVVVQGIHNAFYAKIRLGNLNGPMVFVGLLV